jgi:hypothetical protein
MTIDWFRWRHADKVPLHTAVALACDIDPDVIESRLSGNAHSLDLFLIDLSFFERFLSFASECLPQEITLPEFAKWHDETGIGKLPDEFPRITGNCVSGIPITPTGDIEIELPVSEDYMRLGDALETVPMLIAFALFPRGGEMVRGAKRIENGVEIIKQSQGPDDTEIKKLIESGEWTPITMDMEIYQQTMRNEVAQEWREKLESAAKAGRLAIIDSLSRLPTNGMNPDNLISVQALKDWCASMGVSVRYESGDTNLHHNEIAKTSSQNDNSFKEGTSKILKRSALISALNPYIKDGSSLSTLLSNASKYPELQACKAPTGWDLIMVLKFLFRTGRLKQEHMTQGGKNGIERVLREIAEKS